MIEITPANLTFQQQQEPRTTFISELFKNVDIFSFDFDITSIDENKVIEVVNCILSGLVLNTIIFSFDWKNNQLAYTPIRKQDEELFCILNLLYNEQLYKSHPEYAVNIKALDDLTIPFQQFLNYKNILLLERELTSKNEEYKIDLLDTLSHNIKNAKITTFNIDHGTKQYEDAKLI